MKFLAFFIAICSFTSLLQAKPYNLKVATFNIRFFGLGGEMIGLTRDEFRDEWIKEYLHEGLKDHDVIVFQEIVDDARLGKLLSPYNFDCTTYKHNSPIHQKVVACLKSHLYLEIAPGDTNFTIEEVTEVIEGKPRPALYGVIVEKNSKKEIAYLVGVHLKAYADFSEIRLKQLKIINERIKQIVKVRSLPVIITGDFNSHKADQTKLPLSDLDMMKEELASSNLLHVSHPYSATYKVGAYENLFDHIFVSAGTKVTNVNVGTACSTKKVVKGTRFSDIAFFNRFISDHCPLMADLVLNI
jgi:hypothetical protein